MAAQPADHGLAIPTVNDSATFGLIRLFRGFHGIGATSIRYTLAQRGTLTTVLRDGRACLHNNAAERRMRPLALGRKNYLFAGSLEGGRRAAIIYTLVATVEMKGWDPQAYLRVLLERIADHPINRIGELAPWILRPDTA